MPKFRITYGIEHTVEASNATLAEVRSLRILNQWINEGAQLSSANIEEVREIGLDRLVIGRIYKSINDGRLFRIFGGDGRYYSGRGCTKKTAIPTNHIKARDMKEPTGEEINAFLEEEMREGMTQKQNKRA